MGEAFWLSSSHAPGQLKKIKTNSKLFLKKSKKMVTNIYMFLHSYKIS